MDAFDPSAYASIQAFAVSLGIGLLIGLEQERKPDAKALIAPHAGYIYSGPIAASAYALLRPYARTIRSVVLLGPCHRIAVRGLAVPHATAFATPLGNIPLEIRRRSPPH